jgi:hypothetical protein
MSMAATSIPGATTAKAGVARRVRRREWHCGMVRIRAPGDAGTTNNTDRRIDGACTITGGGGELELQNLSINVGQQITVNTATYTQPK